MRIKSVIGTLVAFGAAALAAVSVQAATYSVATTLSEDSNTVTMNINVAPDSDSESVDVNAYALQVSYDSAVLTPTATGETDATGADMYATNELSTGVMTADVIEDSSVVAVGWADSEATTIDDTTTVATITFNVEYQTTTTVTVTVVALATDSATLETNVEGATGTITFSSDFLRGDANGDGTVDSTDATLIIQSLIGNSTIDEENEEKADANNDDSIDSTDATLIIQSLIGNATITQ